jgi:hypothetical protein
MDNSKSILEAMEMLRKSINKPDALEEKGVDKDCVCCMNPQTYADIERWIKANEGPYPENSVLGAIDRVAMLVQRRVFIFNDIEYGRLEYMPFQRAYARDMLLLFEMRKVSKD